MEVTSSDDISSNEGGDSTDDVYRVQWATRGIVSTTSEEVAQQALQKASINRRHFVCVLPEEDARAHAPPRGYITAFLYCLKSGITIPYHPVVKRFFQLHGISPMQLSPNVWATYASMHIIWHKTFGITLSVAKLCFIYQLKKSQGQKVFYYIGNYGKSRVPTIVVGKPSSNKRWKLEYIFLSGDVLRY